MHDGQAQAQAASIVDPSLISTSKVDSKNDYKRSTNVWLANHRLPQWHRKSDSKQTCKPTATRYLDDTCNRSSHQVRHRFEVSLSIKRQLDGGCTQTAAPNPTGPISIPRAIGLCQVVGRVSGVGLFEGGVPGCMDACTLQCGSIGLLWMQSRSISRSKLSTVCCGCTRDQCHERQPQHYADAAMAVNVDIDNLSTLALMQGRPMSRSTTSTLC
jgi:hypothetical protein